MSLFRITRPVASISDELGDQLGMIACEQCGHWYAPEQIHYVDVQKFHPLCPVHFEEYQEAHAGELAAELDEFRRQEAGMTWRQR